MCANFLSFAAPKFTLHNFCKIVQNKPAFFSVTAAASLPPTATDHVTLSIYRMNLASVVSSAQRYSNLLMYADVSSITVLIVQ